MGGQHPNRGKHAFIQLFTFKNEENLIHSLQNIVDADLTQKEFLESHFPSDLRSIIKKNPEETKSIIFFLFNQLQAVKNETITVQVAKKILTAVRLISSFVPIFWESDNRALMVDLFWKKNVKENDQDRLDDTNQVPLMLAIIKQLFSLLFLPNFTIGDQQIDTQIEKQDLYLNYFDEMFKNLYNYKLNHNIIWRGFIKVCSYPNDKRKYYENRLAVLQALQACISQSLYLPPQIIGVEKRARSERSFKTTTPNPSLLAIYSFPLYPELIVSLLSLVFFQEERNLFFQNALLNPNTLDQELQIQCAKLITIILCGQTGVRFFKELFENINFPDLLVTTKYFQMNQCNFPQLPQLPKKFVVSLFAQISNQIWSVLKLDSRVIGVFQTQNEIYQELMIILTYYLIQIEPEAVIKTQPPIMPLYLIASLNKCEIISSLGFYGFSLLSSCPQILKQLSELINVKINNDDFPVISGKWTDLIIHSWSLMIINKSQQNLIPSQVASVFLNISPIVSGLQPQSARKLLQLTKYLATYDFLLSNPQNFTALCQVVTAIYQILQQNMETSQYLLLEIIKYKDLFVTLENLTVTDQKLQYFCQNIMQSDQHLNTSLWIHKSKTNTEMEKSEDDLRNEEMSKNQSIVVQKKGESPGMKSRRESSKQDSKQDIVNENDAFVEKKVILQPYILNFQQKIPSNNKQSVYEKLKDSWNQTNITQIKEETPLKLLEQFLNNFLMTLYQLNIRECELTYDELNQIMKKRNFLFLLDTSYQLKHQKFDINIGYTLINKITWQTIFKKSDWLPHYEVSECIYWSSPYI